MDGTTTDPQVAPPPQTTPADDSNRGWDAASGPDPSSATPPAQGSDPTQGGQPSAAQPATPGQPAAPSANNAAAVPPAPVAPVVTSNKRPGIAGVVDSIADALAGKTAPEIGTDAQGNQYVKQTTMSRGQQWVRIGAGLVADAAKGMAAGKGRNPGAAAAAGFDSAQQQAQQQAQATPELQKQILANANYQKLRMDTAEQAWHLGAMQHEASQHDVEFAQAQEDRLMKVYGAKFLDHADSPNDIDKILKVDPNVMENMIRNHQIEILPHYDANGKAAGISVYKMPPGYRSTIAPAGTTFSTFDSDEGKMVEHKTSEPMTNGEIDDYNAAATNAAQKFKIDQANLAKQQAETDKTKAETGEANANAVKTTAEATKVPSEIAENKGRTSEAYANATKALAEGKKLSEADANDPNVAILGETIARGDQTLDQIPAVKGMKAAVSAYLSQHHPNLDQTSVVLDAAARKQKNLASNSLENINHIDEILQRRPDLIGVINGRITQGKLGAGTNDQDLGYIEEAMDNFGLATTGTHGTRAQAAREDARAALLNGFKNGPQAVKGAIAAARNSLGNLASVGKPRGTNGQPYVYGPQGSAAQPAQTKAPIAPPAGAPAGASQVWHDAQGKILGYTVNGNYQAAK